MDVEAIQVSMNKPWRSRRQLHDRLGYVRPFLEEVLHKPCMVLHSGLGFGVIPV